MTIKIFEIFFNEIGCKKFSNFFSMKLTVKNFRIFFTAEFIAKKLRKFFTVNFIEKISKIFNSQFEAIEKNFTAEFIAKKIRNFFTVNFIKKKIFRNVFQKIRKTIFLPQKTKGSHGGGGECSFFSSKIRHDLSLGFDILTPNALEPVALILQFVSIFFIL